MIILTGDVHSRKMGGWEQKSIGSEIIAARRYLDILKKNKISSTLFINGISLNNKIEKEEVRELLKYDVELGGHTYDNFGGIGQINGYIYKKIWRCLYGPLFYQRRDIKKTRKSFERFGIKMASWRTHAFGSNNNTFRILEREGVEYVSDILGDIKPFKYGRITHIPINIPVDQNSIEYGELKPENKNPFISCTKGRIKPEEWFEILKKRVKENEKNRILSVLLIHPATMAYLDNFKLFQKIAKFLSDYKSTKISEFEF